MAKIKFEEVSMSPEELARRIRETSTLLSLTIMAQQADERDAENHTELTISRAAGYSTMIDILVGAFK